MSPSQRKSQALPSSQVPSALQVNCLLASHFVVIGWQLPTQAPRRQTLGHVASVCQWPLASHTRRVAPSQSFSPGWQTPPSIGPMTTGASVAPSGLASRPSLASGGVGGPPPSPKNTMLKSSPTKFAQPSDSMPAAAASITTKERRQSVFATNAFNIASPCF
jgi:hypothetical protein